MIDRINNNPYTNAYSQSQVKKTSNEDAPQFLLGNEDEGVIWEKSSEKKASKSVEQNKKNVTPVKNDTVEISSIKTEADKTKESDNSSESSFSFSATLKSFADGIKNFFSQILKAVWYDDEAKSSNVKNTDGLVANDNNSSLNESINKTPKAYDSVEKDRLIRESISKKDNEEVMRILTDNYSKTPARNTTLLTKYDKRGKLANVDGADEVRILTDKKGMKL